LVRRFHVSVSCIFMSCYLVRHFHVLQFHALQLAPSISCPAISCPSFSAPPNGSLPKAVTFDNSLKTILKLSVQVTYWSVDFAFLFEHPYFYGEFSADKNSAANSAIGGGLGFYFVAMFLTLSLRNFVTDVC